MVDQREVAEQLLIKEILNRVIKLPWKLPNDMVSEKIRNDLINRGYSAGFTPPVKEDDVYRAAIPTLLWLNSTKYYKRQDNPLLKEARREKLLDYFSINNNSSIAYALPPTIKDAQQYIASVMSIFASTTRLVPMETSLDDIVSSIKKGDTDFVRECERPGLLIINHPMQVNYGFKYSRGSIFNLFMAREKYKRLTLLVDFLPQESIKSLNTRKGDALPPIREAIKHSIWTECNMENIFYSGNPYWIMGPLDYTILLNEGRSICP